MRRSRRVRQEMVADPFAEHGGRLQRVRLPALGGMFEFESNSRELLRIARHAYEGLPRHRVVSPVPVFRVGLHVLGGERDEMRGSGRGSRDERDGLRASGSERAEPPPLSLMGSCAGFLYAVSAGAPNSRAAEARAAGPKGAAAGRVASAETRAACASVPVGMNASSFVVMAPGERRALVGVPREMLQFPYHTRYELIEFAVYMLAARAQALVPLHAACVGGRGRGLLILGPSGAGKSTLALHAALNGLDFVAEDSVLIAPQELIATGAPTFLHVRADSLRFLSVRKDIELIRRSPVIRRRSGVAKFEVDLRRPRFHLARAPLKIHAAVLLSAQPASGSQLRPLTRTALRRELNESQPYARTQPGWRTFCAGMTKLPAYELRRGRHPQDSVDAIHELLGQN